MTENKSIFAIIGSASENSANQKIIDHVAKLSAGYFSLTVFNHLKQLPHFDPELSINNTPQIISELRHNIEKADGILICTPEYVFSIPSGLKNMIEWCVSTTVFSDKPTGIITASASGAKGHEELQLIMKTIVAKFDTSTTLLIQGVKGKVNENGEIVDSATKDALANFIEAFRALVFGSD